MSWSRAGWREYLRRIGRPELIPHLRSRSFAGRPARRVAGAAFRRPSRALRSSTSIPRRCWFRRKWGAASRSFRCESPTSAFGCCGAACGSSPPTRGGSSCSPGETARRLQTIDQTEIPVELELPETIDRVVRAAIVIESNGGTRRVEVRIERPADALLDGRAGGGLGGSGNADARETAAESGWRGSVCLPERLYVAAVPLGLRLLLALLSALPIGGAASSRRRAADRVGRAHRRWVSACCAGLILAKRRGEPRDLLTGGVAGGLLGLLSSAPLFSMLPVRGARSGLVVDVGRGRLSLLGGSRCGCSRCSRRSSFHTAGKIGRRAHDGQVRRRACLLCSSA